MQGFRQFSQKKLPKWLFRARLPPNFTEQASKTSVSRDASENFYRKSFQKDRFVRGFRQFSQKKLPKWSFRAMLPPNFIEQASKTSVSRDAADNFHRKSFQNDRFVRGFLQISQNHASKTKTSVSHDTSDNFHRKSFQNDRFVQSFFRISQNNAPKTSVLRDASDNFKLNSHIRHTDSCKRVHPPKAKSASHYRAVHFQISKCTFRYSGVRKNVWIYRPWTDPLRAHKNATFYYNFRRSTPRF